MTRFLVCSFLVGSTAFGGVCEDLEAQIQAKQTERIAAIAATPGLLAAEAAAQAANEATELAWEQAHTAWLDTSDDLSAAIALEAVLEAQNHAAWHGGNDSLVFSEWQMGNLTQQQYDDAMDLIDQWNNAVGQIAIEEANVAAAQVAKDAAWDAYLITFLAYWAASNAVMANADLIIDLADEIQQLQDMLAMYQEFGLCLSSPEPVTTGDGSGHV